MFGKEDQEFSFGYDKQMPVRYTGGDVGNMDRSNDVTYNSITYINVKL